MGSSCTAKPGAYNRTRQVAWLQLFAQGITSQYSAQRGHCAVRIKIMIFAGKRRNQGSSKAGESG